MEDSQVRSHFPTFVYCWSLLPWWLRPRLRLSLRALMLLVLIVGGGLGWVVHGARVQRDAVRAIERAGGTVRYQPFILSSKNYKFESPKFLLDLLGPDYIASVNSVYLPQPPRRARRGRGRIVPVNLVDPDEVMAHVGRLSSLEVVQVQGFPITDAGLAHLRGLKRLRTVIIRQTKATGADLEWLAGLHGLQFLDLSGLPIGDAELARMGVLLRSRRAVSPWSVDHFLHINLSQTQVTDAGLLHLAGLRRHVLLNVQGTSVTAAGAAAFLKVQRGTVDR